MALLEYFPSYTQGILGYWKGIREVIEGNETGGRKKRHISILLTRIICEFFILKAAVELTGRQKHLNPHLEILIGLTKNMKRMLRKRVGFPLNLQLRTARKCGEMITYITHFKPHAETAETAET